MTGADDRDALRSTVLQWGSKLAVLAVSIGSTAYLARALGPADYGRFAIALTFQSVVLVVADFGLSMSSVRHLARGEVAAGDLMSTLMVWRVGFAGVVAAGSVGVAALLYRHDHTALLATAVAAAGVLPATASAVAVVLYQTRVRLHVVAFVEVATRIGAFALMVAAVAAGGGPVAVVAVTVVASLVSFAVLRLMEPGAAVSRGQVDRRLFVTLMQRAVPLGIALVLNVVYFRIDAVMLSSMRGFADTGAYAAAYRVMEAVLVFPSVLGQSVLPLLAAAADDRAALQALFRRMIRVVLAATVPITGIGIALAAGIVSVVGGRQFASAGPTLRVLLLAALVSSVDIVLGLVIVATGRQGKALWLNVSGLALNIGLNTVLIPRWGATGAATATLASEGFVLVCAVGMLSTWFGLRLPGLPLVRIGTATAAAAGTYLGCRLAVPSGVAAAAAVVVYVVVTAASGEVRMRDVRSLLRRDATPSLVRVEPIAADPVPVDTA